ncbi:MAG: phage tail assembly protein [Chloroflexota bacterium]
MNTQYTFTLPRGYVDEAGTVHRDGVMRLATALDEIEAVEHPRVQEKPAFLPVLLLARVVVQLGEVTAVSPRTIASLFAADLLYLQDLYLRLNGTQTIQMTTMCPHCQQTFAVQVAPLEG